MRIDIDRWPISHRPYKEPDTVIEVRKRKICELCNKANARMLHHKDCDPSNNTIENLAHLCNSCHRKTHTYFPNWRYLHDEEIRFIIKEANRILSNSDSDKFQYSDPQGDKYSKTTKEEWDAVQADIMNHPLPY